MSLSGCDVASASLTPVSVCCSYAYLECATEKMAYELSDKYKDAEINGGKLYVIQAISEKKDKFGQLQHRIITSVFQ